MTEVYSADWVLPVSGTPIEHGGVAVDGSRIVAVGPAEELEGEREHFADAIIVPGFVNAHSHLEYAAYAGFGDGLEFPCWLSLHIERKARLDWEGMLASARLGVAECLSSGITTVADASFSGAAAVAASELGLRAIVHLEVFGPDDTEIRTRFEPNRDRVVPFLSDSVELGISPHALYSASLPLFRASLELGLPVATHLAESRAESSWLTSGRGAWAEAGLDVLLPPLGTTGIRALADAGLLSSRMVAAHCIQVDAEEIELLGRHGVAVAHCPRSNGLLGCGVAPVAALREAGVRVGLGTDSPASAPSFDAFDEMRAAMLLARASAGDPGALTARDALRLATLGSAEALGLDGEVGSLEPGKRADLAIVSLAGTACVPCDDPEIALVLCGAPGRVWRTIVDGRTRFATGGSGWHELRQAAASARGRMLARSPRMPAGPST